MLAGLWLWLRDSPLVAVRRVTVTGVSGPDAPRVRAALRAAAQDMTTLHVRHDRLRTAVEPFPTVLGVATDADLPHGLRIEVRERDVVVAAVAGAQRVAVAADGTLVRGGPTDGLPEIAAKALPVGRRAGAPDIRRAVAVLAAAPRPLRARVRRVYLGPHGLTLPLRNGPTLYFGGSERLRAKWVAAAVVLADPTSTGATYLDLRLPERPAAGGLEQPPEPPAGAQRPAAGAPQAGQATIAP